MSASAPGGMGVRAADEGHARYRAALVCRSSRMAPAWHRARRTAAIVAVHIRAGAVNVGRLGEDAAQTRPVRLRLGRHCPSRSGCGCRLPPRSSGGAPKRDARWTVPVAAALAVPAMWPGSLAIMAACWPLLKSAQKRSQEPPSGDYHPADGQPRPGDGASQSPGRPTSRGLASPWSCPPTTRRARIGSALDELFGYLRRGGPAREGGRVID